jgi:hypothetical protein
VTAFRKRGYHKRDVSASASGRFFMQVYLDESGDMGWSFSKPYRAGGSSRFLCLAIMFLPKADRKRPKRIIANMYKKYGWIAEKKGSAASPAQKLEFALRAVEMLGNHKDIRIDCIVAKKENVQAHIRDDPNKLYNYMCRLVIAEYVKGELEFEFLPDKRSIKVKSGNSLSDYLQTVLWFDYSLTTRLINNPQESGKNYNLQFMDWMAHCVWSHFEDGETTVFDKLSPAIKVRQLFF